MGDLRSRPEEEYHAIIHISITASPRLGIEESHTQAHAGTALSPHIPCHFARPSPR